MLTSLESMSGPEEDEDDIPDDNDSTRSDVVGEANGDGEGEGEGGIVVADVVAVDGNGNGSISKDEEDSSDDLFDAVIGPEVPDRLSSRAASESAQSGSGNGTEDDSIGPVMPSDAARPTAILQNNKPTAGDFMAHDHVRFCGPRRRRVGRPDAYTTPLQSAPPATFPPPPSIIAKTNRQVARRVGNGRSHARTRLRMYHSHRVSWKARRRTGPGVSLR